MTFFHIFVRFTNYNKNSAPGLSALFLEGTTEIVHHYDDAGHVPDKVSILAVEHNYTKRKVHESLHILSHPNATNCQNALRHFTHLCG